MFPYFRSLEHDSYGRFGIGRLFPEPFFRLRLVPQDHHSRRAAGYAPHFRVVPVPDDDGQSPLPGSFPDDAVDAAHIGAGGVHHPAAPGFQGPIRRLRLPMGADEHRRSLRDLLHAACAAQAQAAQPVHLHTVVDQLPQDPAAPGRLLLRDGDRAPDPVAEARCPRDPQIHGAASFSSRPMRRISSSA